MDPTKRDILFKSITNHILTVLDDLDNKDKLDHFTINISNHNGNLQSDHTIKERIKVY